MESDFPPASGGNSVFTLVRLGESAALHIACQLAGIPAEEVSLVQPLREPPPLHIISRRDFRIVTFDGAQITISERIKGERRVRGFNVGDQPPQTTAA